MQVLVVVHWIPATLIILQVFPSIVCLTYSRIIIQVSRIAFPPDGGSSRYVVALAFSPCGRRLAAVTGDNRHTIMILDWRTGAVISQGTGHNGQPPQVTPHNQYSGNATTYMIPQF